MGQVFYRFLILGCLVGFSKVIFAEYLRNCIQKQRTFEVKIANMITVILKPLHFDTVIHVMDLGRIFLGQLRR